MVGIHKATYEHLTIIISIEVPYLKSEHGILGEPVQINGVITFEIWHLRWNNDRKMFVSGFVITNHESHESQIVSLS